MSKIRVKPPEFRWFSAVWGAVILALTMGTSPVSAAPSCESREFEGATFTTCTVRADKDDIRLFHSDADGKLYGSFRAIDVDLAQHGQKLSMAMNAGMYHDDRRPVGLYVENGKETARLVTREGPGNFGLLPNGVFCIRPDSAAVIESRTYAETSPNCRDATQSGPLLVIDGALHPRFLVDSDSRYYRNGVGVSADGKTVYFVISDDRVNFHTFGRFFRDVLKTPNALYLDGKVSRLHAPSLNRSDPGFSLGPIVGVVSPK